MWPTNRRLESQELDLRSEEADRLLRRWGRLHAFRTILSGLAFLVFLSVLITKRLLVGHITTRVNGMLSRRSSPPTSQARSPSIRHDTRAAREPITASGTCIKVARL